MKAFIILLLMLFSVSNELASGETAWRSYSNWSDCKSSSTSSQPSCVESGVRQRHMVECFNISTQRVLSNCSNQPYQVENCKLTTCLGYEMKEKLISKCNTSCGNGYVKYNRYCINNNSLEEVDWSLCNSSLERDYYEPCTNNSGCNFKYKIKEKLISKCNTSCGNGYIKYNRYCTNNNSLEEVDWSLCNSSLERDYYEPCTNNSGCNFKYEIKEKLIAKCNTSCGNGNVKYNRYCVNNNSLEEVDWSLCNSSLERDYFEPCTNNSGCNFKYEMKEKLISKCNTSCGNGNVKYNRYCTNNNSLEEVDWSLCNSSLERDYYESCTNNSGCNFTYEVASKIISHCDDWCSGGYMKKYRYCVNSETKTEVDWSFCHSALERNYSEECNRRKDCIEGEWSHWGQCNAPCGIGAHTRRWTCPFSNKNCLMKGNKETQNCSLIEFCSINGGWSLWGSWSSCSQPCGASGSRNRTRECNNPPPAFGGNSCFGTFFDDDACNRFLCPVHGGWSEWSAWNACSQACNSGVTKRLRTCNNPEPFLGGESCSGDNEQSRFCNSQACRTNVGVLVEVKLPNENYHPSYGDPYDDSSRKVFKEKLMKQLKESGLKFTDIVIHSIRAKPP